LKRLQQYRSLTAESLILCSDIQKAIEEGHITVAVSEAYTGNKNEYEEKT
jgi:hypothetical protein